MSSQIVRRDMSYRKPVPKYEPSPPPSPHPLPQLSTTSLGNELPLLPQNWSQASQGERNSSEPNVELLVPSMLEYGVIPSIVIEAVDFGTPKVYTPSLLGDSRASTTPVQPEDFEEKPTVASYAARRKRGLHRNYRPPTPPLPAQHKRRRMTIGLPAYDENPASSECPSHLNPNINAKRSRSMGASLHVTPSFTTEKTFVSVMPIKRNPSNLSSGWSGGLTTYVSESDPRLSCYPLLPINSPYTPKDMYQVDIRKLHLDPESSTMSERIGGLVSSFSMGVRKLFCC